MAGPPALAPASLSQTPLQETTMASNDPAPQGGRSTRGFASMDPERQRQIASQGGKAAHEKGTAHEFTPEEAREAGSKGGKAAHQKGTAHEFDSEEAREAGRKGGHASGGAAGDEEDESGSSP
jgi:general stress protein YciG